MLVNLSVTIMEITVSVAFIQLEVSVALMQVTVPTANMWMTIFITIMQMVYSAVHYAHDWFCCNYAGNCFCYSHIGKVSSSNFIFLSLTHTFDQINKKKKHLKGILSVVHFNTFLNILPTLRYFEGRNYIQIG